MLAHLAYAGDVSVRDIEARVALEKSPVSRAASRLEQAGYVSKATGAGDWRLLCLRLTSEGQTLVRQILPLAQGVQGTPETRLGSTLPRFEEALERLLQG